MIPVPDNIKSLLSKSPAFFSQLYTFNYTPASYLHPTRRFQFFEDALPALVWEEPRVWAKLSSLMLDQLGLSDQPCIDFPHPKWELALLPVSRQQRLAQHIGAIVLGARIRSSLAREQVLKWKEQLGQDTFQFVMNSARLLPTIRIEDEALENGDVEQIGYDMLCASVNDAPPEMRQRVLLKMPVQTKPTTISPKLVNQLVQSVTLTLEAEWHSSFAVIKN
jgi:hypothetical protein